MRSGGSISCRRLGVPASPVAVTVAVAAAVIACGCTGSSGSSGSTGSAASTVTSTAVVAAPAPSIEDPIAALDAALQTSPPVSQVTLPAAVESTGIPGLDSPDAFCAAWSRFAGSFQVVAVTAAFGEGGPEAVASLEVVAAPVVVDAYEMLLDAWPAELEPERGAVADQVLGPFQRRLSDALALLQDLSDDATVDTVRSAWLATLAARDPASPEVSVDLGDAEWAIVDAAAAAYLGVRAPFGDDPSLINEVPTPLTDAYLAATCPDQGLLAGQDEIGG